MYYFKLNSFLSYFTFIVFLTRNGGKAIMGGSPALPGLHGYHVTIVNEKTCGGSLLTEYHVITAGHCVLRRDTMELIPGDHRVYFYMEKLDENGQILPNFEWYILAQNFYVHTEYKMQNDMLYGYDIAIIRLERSVRTLPIRDYLKFLKLPDARKNYKDEELTFTGMGYDKVDIQLNWDGSYKYEMFSSFRLQYGISKVWSSERCRAVYMMHDDTHICAQMQPQSFSGPIRGTCLGDSGGPLVLMGTYLVGVLTRGLPHCSELYSPSIFVKVTYFKNWINQALKNDCSHSHMTCLDRTPKI